jgi:cytochrome c-type biogenesis protein CcmH
MSGLFILLLLAAAALGIMWLAGLRGPLLTFAAAALMLGGAGYAVQGRPSLDGSPRAGKPPAAPIPLDRAREMFMGRFNTSDRWLIMADALAARGKTEDAVGILRSAVRAHPRDYGLWVGLGNALTDHARTITPAARFAFARAKQIAPNAPAPDYFLGLALLRSGEPEEALRLWQELLAGAPAEASWRPLVEDGVALVSAALRTPPPAAGQAGS